MFDSLRTGWRGCTARQKLGFLSAVFAVLLAVVCLSVFFTAFYFHNTAAGLGRSLQNEIGAQSVSSLQCAKDGGTLRVTVNLNDPILSSEQADDFLSGGEQPDAYRFYADSLYIKIFLAVRKAALTRPDCQDVTANIRTPSDGNDRSSLVLSFDD
ncbi:hypothetical protein [Caproicibacter sp.]|uniref:hypothetical protein n=1 Tax=Caproicibacter sp. TaxID=2814884 RepID=UPI003988F878